MNDKQQIEEMVKVMCGNDCEECVRESAEFYKQTIEEARNNHCLLKNSAKTLYNANYRKLPENAVVLTRELYDYMVNNARLVEEQARKETAREIYQQLQGHGTTYVKKWIKEQCGVEV